MTAPILTFIEMHGMNAMADILDELRDACDLARTPQQLEKLCGQAAREIKRLRSLSEILQKKHEETLIAIADIELWNYRKDEIDDLEKDHDSP